MGGVPQRGWNSVTVPGVVLMWSDLSRRAGRLPFESLFTPAIKMARSGFVVSSKLAERWAVQVDELADQAGFAQAFMPGGRGPKPNDVFSNPPLADTLEQIATSHGTSFYEGALANKIIDHCLRHGGAMSLDDLARHRTTWSGTISFSFAGRQIHEAPLNSQGVVVPMTLGIFSHLGALTRGADTLDSIHFQIEAFKLATADIARHAGMSPQSAVTAEELLDPSYQESRAALVGDRAQMFGPGLPMGRGTVVVVAADSGGKAITLLQSNYAGFGSGVVVADTGISMHNRGACFANTISHPNAPGPGRKPLHTLLPAMVLNEGKLEFCLGVTGGNMQPQGQIQVLLRMLLDGAAPLSAIDAPRYRHASGLSINLEPDFPDNVRAGLIGRGHQVAPIQLGYMDFGSAQVIRRKGDHWEASSDDRKDGAAIAA